MIVTVVFLVVVLAEVALLLFGNQGAGLVLLILTGLGWRLVLRHRDRRPCPYCAERIRVEARVCPRCQRQLEPVGGG